MKWFATNFDEDTTELELDYDYYKFKPRNQTFLKVFQTMVQNKQNKTYVTNLSHIKQVVTGGPVGCVWPSAKGLVIGAATERTLGTPDSVRLNEKVKRVIEYQRSYRHRIIPRNFMNTIFFSRDPCSTIITMQIA